MTTRVEQNVQIKLEKVEYPAFTNETNRYHGYDDILFRVVDHTRTFGTPFSSNETTIFYGEQDVWMKQKILTRSGEVFNYAGITVTRL